MSELQFKWKQVSEHGQQPTKAYHGDWGYDLYAAERKTLFPNETTLISTGIAIHFAEGYGGLIKDRSGLAYKEKLSVKAGVVDSSYTGVVGVVIRNNSEWTYTVEIGDRIAQMLVLPQYEVEWKQVKELEETERNMKGYGSSGK